MRLVLLASTFLSLAPAAPALAQDEGRSPEAALADAASWTGFYVGGQFGLTRPDSTFDVNFANGNNFFSEDIDDLTIIGGLYVGYAQQLGPMLLGVEGDFSGMPLDHENDDVFFNGKTSFEYSSHWLTTVRGTAGVTFADAALYGTGGLAVGEVDASLSDTFAGATDTGSSSDVKLGWTAGGGALLNLNGHWRAKAEYLFVDLDDTGFTTSPNFNESVSVDNIFHVARVGLARKF